MAEAVERQRWMAVLAKAPAEALSEAFAALGADSEAFAALGADSEAEWLRPPEQGAVMVRGRMGGTGAPFNLGEMTVTRATLRLADGTVGHAYVSGRDAGKARIAAICDALMQGPEAPRVRAAVIAPMEALLARQRSARAGKAEGTRVEFFTMVRGED